MEFQVGDRVIAVTGIDSRIRAGDTGVITRIKAGNIHQRVGVYWDCFMDGHTLGEICPNGHGWWVYANKIELDYSYADDCDSNIADLI